jgi:hypothetical protein
MVAVFLRNRWLYAALVALLLIVVSATAAWNLRTLKDRPPPERRPEMSGGESFDRFQLQGFRHTSYHMGRKVFAVEAEEILHRRHRVGPMAVNPFRELVLSGVRIELNPSPEPSGPGGDPSVRGAVENMLLQEKLGLVSRVIFRDLTLSYSRGDVFRFRVRSPEATIDLATRSVLFPDVFLLESASGDRLEGEDVVWADDFETFHARGPYIVHEHQRVTPGRNTYFVVQESGKVLRRGRAVPPS